MTTAPVYNPLKGSTSQGVYMFCNNCGNQVPDTANVCPQCGNTLARPAQQPQYQQPPQPQQPTYQQPAQPQYQQPQYQQPQYQQPQYQQPQYQQPGPPRPRGQMPSTANLPGPLGDIPPLMLGVGIGEALMTLGGVIMFFRFLVWLIQWKSLFGGEFWTLFIFTILGLGASGFGIFALFKMSDNPAMVWAHVGIGGLAFLIAILAFAFGVGSYIAVYVILYLLPALAIAGLAIFQWYRENYM